MSNKSSWEVSSQSYNKIVGDSGHYYHQHVVLPEALRLLELKQTDILADIGCGQGILARKIRQDIEYWGSDISKSLIRLAKQYDSNRLHQYQVDDVTQSLSLPKAHFTKVAFILSIQNIKDVKTALTNASLLLKKDGEIVLLLNHPCFRIPRQSGWEIDVLNKMQKRWVARYMTPLEIPISMHPGKNNSEKTWSYHYPLSFYTTILTELGFVINNLSELTSDKESEGRGAKMENRSRQDIPLFLALRAYKAGN